MRYSIKLRREWESPPINGQSKIYVPGDYRVPKEMPERAARRALTAGIAVKIMPRRETKKRVTA